jgi:methylthioribose-1-phosphate isomerase
MTGALISIELLSWRSFFNAPVSFHGAVYLNEIRPIQWASGKLRLIDQTRLPLEQISLELGNYQEVVDAIREMRVRGAPAIGVAAAYAVAMASREIVAVDHADFLDQLRDAATNIASARPTAVNLRWGVDRIIRVAAAESDLSQMPAKLLAAAQSLLEQDEDANRRMGCFGGELIPDGGAVLTHCNAGALATAGFGTALGVIRAGWETGKRFQVFNTETRPFLQGSRLTSWEFQQMGIPATLIVDSAAGMLMRRGQISCVITGADRVAANGDTANKIGTYTLAVLARENDIPFYIAAPTSTIDLSLSAGDEIQIEERPASEVTHFQGSPTAPVGVLAINPAFDVTPHHYVTAIVTEAGVARPPYLESLTHAVSIGNLLHNHQPGAVD